MPGLLRENFRQNTDFMKGFVLSKLAPRKIVASESTARSRIVPESKSSSAQVMRKNKLVKQIQRVSKNSTNDDDE